MVRIEVHSEAETDAVARRVGRALGAGVVIALEGPMGAGKTRFVRGLVKALGGDVRQVSSPTFVLLNVYETPRFRVFHLDAYRVSGEEELEAIGFGELLEQAGVTVVEWPSRVEALLPKERVTIRIEPVDVTGRLFEIEGLGLEE